MQIKKITTGFVIQTFDTELGRYISQEFIASDVAEYETEGGEIIKEADLAVHNFGPLGEEPYLPFEMEQPKENVDISEM